MHLHICVQVAVFRSLCLGQCFSNHRELHGAIFEDGTVCFETDRTWDGPHGPENQWDIPARELPVNSPTGPHDVDLTTNRHIHNTRRTLKRTVQFTRLGWCVFVVCHATNSPVAITSER